MNEGCHSPELQREVQRLLGRCMLRLQQYERLMKAMLAHHELAGSVETLEAQQAARVEKLADKSLGTVVNAPFESYVVVEGSKERDLLDESKVPADRVLHHSAREPNLEQLDAVRLNTAAHHIGHEADQRLMKRIDALNSSPPSAATPNAALITLAARPSNLFYQSSSVDLVEQRSRQIVVLHRVSGLQQRGGVWHRLVRQVHAHELSQTWLSYSASSSASSPSPYDCCRQYMRSVLRAPIGWLFIHCKHQPTAPRRPVSFRRPGTPS